MNKWDIEKKIIQKALKDPAFKAKLLANPKEAVKDIVKEAGLNPAVLNSLDVICHQDKKSEWHIHLPSEEEIDSLKNAVGGGFNCEVP